MPFELHFLLHLGGVLFVPVTAALTGAIVIASRRLHAARRELSEMRRPGGHSDQELIGMIEQLSLEVERLAESQRFTVKLLAGRERPPAQ